jgi:hypothetical protein
MVIEHDVAADVDPKWTVGGPGPGVQSRALAVDVDDRAATTRSATPASTSASRRARSGSTRRAASSRARFRWAPSGRPGSVRMTSPGARPATPSSPGRTAGPVHRVQGSGVRAEHLRAAVDLHPERQAGDPDRVRRGGRPLRRGLRRRDRRRRAIPRSRSSAARRPGYPGGGANPAHAVSTRLAATPNPGP